MSVSQLPDVSSSVAVLSRLGNISIFYLLRTYISFIQSDCMSGGGGGCPGGAGVCYLGVLLCRLRDILLQPFASMVR